VPFSCPACIGTTTLIRAVFLAHIVVVFRPSSSPTIFTCHSPAQPTQRRQGAWPDLQKPAVGIRVDCSRSWGMAAQGPASLSANARSNGGSSSGQGDISRWYQSRAVPCHSERRGREVTRRQLSGWNLAGRTQHAGRVPRNGAAESGEPAGCDSGSWLPLFAVICGAMPHCPC